ncbi:hypothetical protein HKD37_20G056248 [Glycine soja]
MASPVESPTVATFPYAGERGEAHGCAFQRRKDARSRHQRLFVENVGKTEGNRSTKAGLLLLRTLHRRGNQTYAVLFKGESSDSFYLEGDHFKALDLKNDPFTW